MKFRPSFRGKRPWLAAVFACLLVLILFFFRGWTIVIVDPFLSVFSKAAGTLTASLTSEEERALTDQLVALAIDRAEFDRLTDENETLRKELGFSQRTGFISVPATVITKSLSKTVSRFVLDVGASDGVQIGDPIVADDGILVGKVIAVEEGSSVGMALTDPSHTSAVGLLNDRRTIGVAYGTVGGLVEIRFIPSDETIEVNDLVVTSGLEETVPSGLLIGLVNAVSQDPTTLFLTAVVEPLKEIRRLSTVLVLTKEPL
ncbi:rod shape-determining protein MreC [Candidatus Uhrbacteria bacterium]|nr:rod shape-determining protein MreC [Candidatus Uhrbacteria bacterium]